MNDMFLPLFALLALVLLDGYLPNLRS